VRGTALIVTVYRGLQRLYPRTFRDEFGADMVLLFREQLRDEPTWRVCGRGLLDLVITIPIRHVEVHMTRTRTPALVLVVSFALASTVFALVEGLLGVAVAALGAALAMLIWRHERPAPSQRAVAQRWWKLLAGGAALLATVIGVTIATGELSEPAWAIAALTFLVSVSLLGAGLILGLVRLTDRRRTTRLAA
jgi:hypothetical protein